MPARSRNSSTSVGVGSILISLVWLIVVYFIEIINFSFSLPLSESSYSSFVFKLTVIALICSILALAPIYLKLIKQLKKISLASILVAVILIPVTWYLTNNLTSLVNYQRLSPDIIPVYTGATNIVYKHSANSAGEGGNAVLDLTFDVSASPKDVIIFYQQSFDKQGLYLSSSSIDNKPCIDRLSSYTDIACYVQEKMLPLNGQTELKVDTLSINHSPNKNIERPKFFLNGHTVNFSY